MSWVAAAIAGTGLVTSLYGANKQNKANKAAEATNIAQQDKQNNASWTSWLMSRGLAPTGSEPFTAGAMPTAANSRAVNTRLPLYATLPARPRRLVRRAG